MRRIITFAITAGAALVLWLGRVEPRAHEVRHAAVQRPIEHWLSHEAEETLFAHGGMPGPLFEGVTIGGPPPEPMVRERIAAFARANHVSIDLDVSEGALAAVRVAIEFGGCCGYEGAELLALRLGRPNTTQCCGCGVHTWANVWAIAFDDGTHLRAQLKVNRIDIAWQPTLVLSEVLDRAESLLGTPAPALAARHGERLHELEPGRDFVLALPYGFAARGGYETVRYSASDLGLRLSIEHGRVAEVSFGLPADDDDIVTRLVRRWGRRRADGSWHVRGAAIAADLDDLHQITLRARS